ncbi:MAG: uridine kinase [Bacteroidota bacterium]
MLGDVLLIQDKHHKAGEAIVSEILKRKKDKFIVAISGESGSGKTELAHVVARGLREHGILAKPLHIDNYYRVLPLDRKEWRINNGIEQSVGYDEYDWGTIKRNIDEFRHGAEAAMPCVDLVTEQVDTLITDFGGVDMLIIDGLYAIKTEEADLSVFIELTYHETKKAQADRGKEPQNEYRWAVLEQEHKMVQALKGSAELLVGMDYEVRNAV